MKLRFWLTIVICALWMQCVYTQAGERIPDIVPMPKQYQALEGHVAGGTFLPVGGGHGGHAGRGSRTAFVSMVFLPAFVARGEVTSLCMLVVVRMGAGGQYGQSRSDSHQHGNGQKGPAAGSP